MVVVVVVEGWLGLHSVKNMKECFVNWLLHEFRGRLVFPFPFIPHLALPVIVTIPPCEFPTEGLEGWQA